MLVAASSRCFSDLPIHQACFHIDDMGYDKVELWFSEASEHLRPSELLRESDRFSVRYREMTRLTPVSFCFEDEIPVADFRTVTRVAKQLRVPHITVPSATLGTPFNSEVDRLRELTRIGIEDGVVVSFKTRIGHLSEDPRTAVELCQAAPGLGITLDPSSYLCGPHHSTNFDPVYPYVFHAHLRDSTREKFQVPVGLGEIDYARLISQLERVNFSRTLGVEILPELMDVTGRGVEMRKVRLLLESLL
ncbi:MAG TPA: sugar phosphate isomerase/epimerase [Planctomycetaceae bacterium]|jgi:sugar phosphate isomerase/epimerase|nr:sugar phosphate isomerase/epimerase [Planctomycetaceae bacterium]